MNTNIKTREYTTVSEVSGPLMVVEGVEGVGYNEIVDIETPTGEKRSGQVLDASGGKLQPLWGHRPACNLQLLFLIDNIILSCTWTFKDPRIVKAFSKK